MKRSLFALGCLLGLAACHSQPNQTTATDPATRPKEPTGSRANVSSSPGTAYHAYRALLPGQADSITLHLVTAPRSFSNPEAPGHYGSYYGADGHPYSLQGQPSATPDSVVLFDTSPEKVAASASSNLYWRLRRPPGRGDLAGTVAGQRVQLRLVQPVAGTLSFAVRYFADSVAAFPREAKSPMGRLSLQALLPVGGPGTAHQALETNMLRDLRGDTLAGLPPVALPTLYQQQRREFFNTYREDAADSRPAPADTAGIGAYGPGLSYEAQKAAYVLYQLRQLAERRLFLLQF